MKLLIKLVIILITYMSLTASKCSKDSESWYFSVKNNSGNAVYYAISTAYPDTSLKNIEDPPGIISNRPYKTTYRINAHEEAEVNSGVFAINKTIILYVFDATILEEELWDSIVLHNKVLKQYIVKKEDIQKRNWILNYP